ncbi:DUF4376 domain-containing protein [Salmonella enterica]|nr:DUF4376 domain-containing protein [Salmonella enterica]
MKYAYFEPFSMKVLSWLDTEQFDIVLPETVMQLSDAQWYYRDRDCWVNPIAGKLVTTPPPGEYYRLEGDKWVFDEEAFAGELTQVKTQFIEAIKAHRDIVTADYIVIEGHHFHSDVNSRIQQITLTKMAQAGAVPPGLMWKTKNNGLIKLTNEIAAQFESVTIDHDMRLFANAQRHIAAVEALEDIEAVQGYDYSTGWQP